MLNRCFCQVLQELTGSFIAGSLGQSSGWCTRLQLLPNPVHPVHCCQTVFLNTAQLCEPLPLPPAGQNPHSLAWQEPTPDIPQPTFSATLPPAPYSQTLPTSLSSPLVFIVHIQCLPTTVPVLTLFLLLVIPACLSHIHLPRCDGKCLSSLMCLL